MPFTFGRSLAVAGALTLAAALGGCGDYHHHDGCCDGCCDDFVGTLEVVNDDDFDAIETVELDDLDSSYHEFFDFDPFLFPGDSVEFDLFPSTYAVTVYWDDGQILSSVEDVFDDTFKQIFVTNGP